MKPEQAKNMIDTINDGREYELTIDKESVVIIHPTEGILFSTDYDDPFEVNTPEKARDIATALMTWVEMKEGQA